MNLKNLAIKNLVFALVILLLIVNVLYLLELVRELSVKVSQEKTKLLSFKNELQKLEDFKNKKASLEKIEQVFVKEKVPIEFINFLEKGAEKFGINIQISFLPDVSPKNSPYKTLTFAVEAEGPFPNLAAFFEYIEFSPFLTQTTNIVFKTPSDNFRNQAELPTLNITLAAYGK